MKKAYLILPLVGVFLVLGLSGCLKPASEASINISTATLSIPIAISTQMPSMKDILSGTQTAMAKTAITPSATVEPVTPTSEFTATNTAYPTSTPGKPQTWTLMTGEHPYCIARRFDVNISDLLSLNGMTNSSRPTAGTILKIPSSGSWSSAHGNRYLIVHPATYTVVSGDTIYSIACRFGDVDPNAILSVNGLSSGSILTPGQTIQIP